MPRRWSEFAIVGFWLAAMGWLVWEKIVPAFRVGEPPTYLQIVGSAPDDEVAAWWIRLDGRQLGHAVSRLERGEGGVVSLSSQVHLNRLPLRELVGGWAATIVSGVGASDLEMPLDTLTVIDVDGLGQIAGFRSFTLIGENRAAFEQEPWRLAASNRIVIRAVRDRAGGFDLSVSTKDIERKSKIDLPQQSLVGDALAPQPRLPNLRVGQTWTVPVYSPFRNPAAPLDLLTARVVRRETIDWGGAAIPAMVVDFTPEEGGELAGQLPLRARAWVHPDGSVLRQQLQFFRATLEFRRIDPDVSPPGMIQAPP